MSTANEKKMLQYIGFDLGKIIFKRGTKLKFIIVKNIFLFIIIPIIIFHYYNKMYYYLTATKCC